MDENLDQQVVATYANIAEALVARLILETAGVPCRMTDDAQLSSALYGTPGSIGRSAAIWVLTADLERARTLLTEMRDGGGVDEAALVEEALAASKPEPRPADAGAKRFPVRTVVFLGLVVVGSIVALIVQLW